VMERRLGELAEPYHEGRAGRYAAWAKRCTIAGAATMALGRRRRVVAVAGGALVLAGGLLERWAVFRAGFQSAQRPADTVRPQRERVTAAAAGTPPCGSPRTCISAAADIFERFFRATQ